MEFGVGFLKKRNPEFNWIGGLTVGESILNGETFEYEDLLTLKYSAQHRKEEGYRL